jgi:hypothetical protein
MPSVTISSPELEVKVNPGVGGAITSVRHVTTGLEVLGTVPWPVVDAPLASLAAHDEPEFLTRYTGGWPLLFPSGGDACTVDGVFHGFHGEGAVAPWAHEATGDTIRLSRTFKTVPVEMHRRLSVAGDTLTLHETVHMRGSRPIEVMWGQHPTFGSDMISAPFEITCAGGRVWIDDLFDSPNNPLIPGASGEWPMIAGKQGPYNLSTPSEVMSGQAYLHDLKDGWLAIRRMDNAIAALLTWDKARFPCAWVWYELKGTDAPPWRGQTSLIGLEPNTTWPGSGIVGAKERGGSLLTISPGDVLDTTLRLRVFKPTGPVRSAQAAG